MESNNKTERVVSAIENGTVIDHIPADALFKVIQILGLSHLSNQMTFGVNRQSQRLGKKGIIRNFKVVEKLEVRLPEQIIGIVRCVNPKCITNNNPVTPKFDVLSDSPVSLRCHYCERITDETHMEYITE